MKLLESEVPGFSLEKFNRVRGIYILLMEKGGQNVNRLSLRSPIV